MGQMVDTCGRNWETQGERNNKRKKKANFMLLVICGKTVYTTFAPICRCQFDDDLALEIWRMDT